VQRRIAGRLAERSTQDIGRQRAAAHPEHHDAVEALRADLGELAQLAGLRVRLLRDLDPAQRVLDDLDVLGAADQGEASRDPELVQEILGGQVVERIVGGAGGVAERQRDAWRRAAAQFLDLAL